MSNVIFDVVNIICGLGYEVIIIKNLFLVLEMICVVCVVSVESIIKYLDGVVNVFVNFVIVIVKVEYIFNIIMLEDLKKVV